MATAYRIKKGDVGVRLSFTLAKPDGSLWNLTGATVTLVMAGGNPPTTVSRVCVVDDAVLGRCHYDLTSEDTSIPGNYKLEVVIDYGERRFTTVTRGELSILETL